MQTLPCLRNLRDADAFEYRAKEAHQDTVIVPSNDHLHMAPISSSQQPKPNSKKIEMPFVLLWQLWPLCSETPRCRETFEFLWKINEQPYNIRSCNINFGRPRVKHLPSSRSGTERDCRRIN
jgi:hypothetical protein